MLKVEKPILFPSVCLNCTGQNHPEGYVDTLKEVYQVDPRMYICAGCVRTMQEVLGFPTKEAHEAVVAENAQLKARVAELESREDEFLELERSVKFTLNHFGENLKNAPGRKVTKA